MKILYRSLFGLIGALAIAGKTFAQVPNTNDTSTSDATQNTGMGTGALGGPNPANLTGYGNTASGYNALYSNTAGYANTASGWEALYNNDSHYNTATGYEALYYNTDGNSNTASGYAALYLNTTGDQNTASGTYALESNTSGSNNTASGYNALNGNYVATQIYATGSNNTGIGTNALYSYSTGGNNTAAGMNALYSNTTGSQNTASGFAALQNSTTGNGNIGVGFQAGLDLTTGSHNIDIGNKGVAAESGTVRIGTKSTQTATYIAGIYNNSLSGLPVVVTSTGQLGVEAKSSERFKTAIAPMGSDSSKLAQLRAVTFHYKANPHGALQYGLIAEEVAKVYPELVIRNEKGTIDGVRYDELAPMLLNEMQQQHAQMTEKIEALTQQVAKLQTINQATQVALRKLLAKDELVAQR
jgi:hypothetical protein